MQKNGFQRSHSGRYTITTETATGTADYAVERSSSYGGWLLYRVTPETRYGDGWMVAVEGAANFAPRHALRIRPRVWKSAEAATAFGRGLMAAEAVGAFLVAANKAEPASLIAELAGDDYVTTNEAAAVIDWCREWARDCEWADLAEDLDIDAMAVTRLLHGCQRHIEGGLRFVLDDVRRIAAQACFLAMEVEMRATSIQLYSRRSFDDCGDPAYCGCWFIPCPDDDPRIADLDRLNLGRAAGDDGVATRSFFFADEIEEMVARAERQTECSADTPWEYGEVRHRSGRIV